MCLHYLSSELQEVEAAACQRSRVTTHQATSPTDPQPVSRASQRPGGQVDRGRREANMEGVTGGREGVVFVEVQDVFVIFVAVTIII